MCMRVVEVRVDQCQLLCWDLWELRSWLTQADCQERAEARLAEIVESAGGMRFQTLRLVVLVWLERGSTDVGFEQERGSWRCRDVDLVALRQGVQNRDKPLLLLAH
jgi:hypothetical protein